MAGVKIALAVVGIFLGAIIIGLSYNDKLGTAWAIVTGAPQSSSTESHPVTPPIHEGPPPIHITHGGL